MLVEAEIWTVARTEKGNAVLVKPVGSDRAVPIFIGQLEAQSILFGLVGVPVPRPMTHDLFISLLEKTSISIERVEITDLKDRTFYSRILMKHGLKRVVIDARPSDSLGIASRIHCPVFIAESIVDEAGVAVNLISEEEMTFTGESGIPDEPAQTVPVGNADPPLDLRSRLERELERAVDAENYEEAARLRDRLNDL